MAVFALLMFSLSGCVEEFEYEGAAALRTAQVYFSQELPERYELSNEQSSLAISLNRINADEELTVPVKITLEDNSLFGTSREVDVVFGKGRKEQTIKLDYDPQGITFGKYETVVVSIADESYTTEYGLSTYTFSAGATEWKAMGTGTMRDGIISAFYGIDNYSFKVVIEENIVHPGVYRVVNPYRYHPYSLLGEGSDEVDPDYYDTSTTHYLTIHAEDPDNIYLLMNEDDENDNGTGRTGLTLNSSEGEIGFISLVQYYMLRGNSVDAIKAAFPEYFGKLENGVITLPADGFLGTLDGDGYYGPLGDALFAIALPGATIADYSFSYVTTGTFVDSRGKEFIEGRFTLGQDVAEVKYALTTADQLDNKIAEILAGGEAASVKTDGSVRIAVEKSGVYYLAMVAYNTSGESVASDYAQIKFQSTHEGGETWEAVGTGIYTYTTYDYSRSGVIWEGSEDATLYRSSKDATRYLISPWANNEEGSGRGLIFNMDEDDNITVDGADTGWEYGSYGLVTASDLITAGIANIPSGYSDGIFYFSLVYQVEAGNLAYVEDQFQLNSPMQSPKKAKHMGQAAKIKKKLNYSLRPLLKRSYYRF